MRRATLLLVLVLVAPPSLGPAAEPRSSPIPFREKRSLDFDAGRVAAAFGLAVAAALGGLYLVRRRLSGSLPAPAGRRLRLVERLRVSPRATVLLLECDGEVVLLGEHPGGLVRLGGGRAMAHPETAAEHAHAPRS